MLRQICGALQSFARTPLFLSSASTRSTRSSTVFPDQGISFIEEMAVLTKELSFVLRLAIACKAFRLIQYRALRLRSHVRQMRP
jgi:hypothetical protein